MSLATLYNDAKAIWRFNNDATDAKGNHDLVNTGATYDGTIKKYGSHSVIMDGLNDFLAAADHADFNGNEYSLVVPVYIASFGVRNTMISKHDTVGDTGWLLTINTSNILNFSAGNGGGGWPGYTASYDISGDGLGWHLMGAIHSLTSHKLLFDDKLVASVAGGAMGTNSKDVWFGRSAQTSAYQAGQQDETVWFTRQLTDGGVSIGQVAGGEWAELYANFLAGVELDLDGEASHISFSIYDKQFNAFKELSGKNTIV
jgi:hypothetical protein